MSFLDNLKKLVSGVRGQIKCPECGANSVQSAEKVQKNIALICPKCGCLFLPQDAPQP
ncbi:YnfU family zinc-binding protein [Yersinia similis]|uniref:Uncharacterized protein n=1 Tax=Yersinia similis TaxID=367190 RepID=A0A0T9QJQ4_9GAMM|nr:YnfU family zinc-binding protein [Yersinia similis]CFQ62931.1 Uncharacterised protein [Yersinia similis]CNB59233.1 Uncharacterised protein [Yersinia similis]CNE97632.1 Uncharacterised protein [Yersinia similis]CNF00528.1 Uncharacterised protein [Yersinia similis]CNI15260.1 Uncharacterised protein [Yersinia similis]